MKKLIALLLLFSAYRASAQDSLAYFNYSREHIKKTGMEVLGTWAVANLAVATPLAYSTTGSTKYFYQMNAIWNVVNLGAAVSGFISADKNINKPLSARETVIQQRKIEKIFLINGGLDVAYIGAGLYLHHRGDNDNSDKLRGYGSGVVLQGAFLLLFDATMYSSEKSNGHKLSGFLKRNPLLFDGKKVGMIIHLGS